MDVSHLHTGSFVFWTECANFPSTPPRLNSRRRERTQEPWRHAHPSLVTFVHFSHFKQTQDIGMHQDILILLWHQRIIRDRKCLATTCKKTNFEGKLQGLCELQVFFHMPPICTFCKQSIFIIIYLSQSISPNTNPWLGCNEHVLKWQSGCIQFLGASSNSVWSGCTVHLWPS